MRTCCALPFSALPWMAAFLLLAPVARSQASGRATDPATDRRQLCSQMDSLAAEAKSLRAELDQAKAPLHDIAARQNPVYGTTSAPSPGDPKAKVVLVGFFSGYQCPHSRQYLAGTGARCASEQTCRDSDRNPAEIREGEVEIARLGVDGTPGFFIAAPDPENFEKIPDTLLSK